MKKLTLLFLTMFALSGMRNASSQNISGDNAVCNDQTLSYLAHVPVGGTFHKWLVSPSILANGTDEYDLEIYIDWSEVSQTTFDLYWDDKFFGEGGYMQVTITQFVTPSILSGSCMLGSGQATFVSTTHTGATNYSFHITGFGLSSPLTPTSTNGQVTVSLPNTSLPGTVKVKAYYGGGCSDWTPYSSSTNFN